MPEDVDFNDKRPGHEKTKMYGRPFEEEGVRAYQDWE
jgi:hypothetical protein